jgi:hypothetical protein
MEENLIEQCIRSYSLVTRISNDQDIIVGKAFAYQIGSK